MRRDELRQPLKRRSFRERLWAKRPSALAAASLVLALSFVGVGQWLIRTPYPFGGEPVLVLAIPPAQEIKTSSLDKAPESPAAPAEPEPPIPDSDPVAAEEAPEQQL